MIKIPSLSGLNFEVAQFVEGALQGFQTRGFRTIPDVAFDADPFTGVAIYDSYNDTDRSGPWIQIGGTSLGAPAWAGLIAIANQGRVLGGGSSLDGPGQALPALYAFPPTDWIDITKGNNGVFSAGPGYDLVTGFGTPNSVPLMVDLSRYGTANHIAVTSQPPANVIVGDRFGVVVAAEDDVGDIDPAFSGTLTIALASNPTGATLGGTLTATASTGFAVFDGLTLDKLGSGYTFKITSTDFPAITTNAFNVIADPTPWQGTFYPVPTDGSLRTAIGLADSNGKAFNTLFLSASTTFLSDRASGGIVIKNNSALASKTLTIVGQGSASTIIGSVFNWHDRIFEIEGSGGQSLNVIIQNLTIQGGNAQDGGILGGSDALGGGLLIDNANVTLSNVTLKNNKAQAVAGADGAAGAIGAGGGDGGNGPNAKGGGVYLSRGTLSLYNDTFTANIARGGNGGNGGAGGGQGTKNAPAVNPGDAGLGGQGGSAAGGGLFAAGGILALDRNSFQSNAASGGAGGSGGTGGSGGHGSSFRRGKQGGAGGDAGAGGAASGGAIYLAGGSLTTTGAALRNNVAHGGAGGAGGHGGPGTLAVASTALLGGGGGTTFSFSGLGGIGGFSPAGGPGGSAGWGGTGGAASGGGVYVAGGTLTAVNATFTGNEADGGNGGTGGQGGTGGFGAATSFFGLPIGEVSGNGGDGGQAGTGRGGGILVAGGSVTLYGDTLNANAARGGAGGLGGHGGSGPLAVVFGSGLGISTGGFGGLSGLSGFSGLGGASGINSGGLGGSGGNGGTGQGAGMYVGAGALTLLNSTVAGNTGDAGAGGSSGPGGRAGTGHLTGGMGSAGNPGDSYGGGFFVNGGTVKLDNTTLASNTQQGDGYGGGAVIQGAGKLTASSSVFAAKASSDYSGNFSATNSLFQAAPINGALSGSGNSVGSNPLLDSNGLQNNGGATATVALKTGSPAIGAGANSDNLFADQRGAAPRTGPQGTDIGAYQTGAPADAQAPTVGVQAATITRDNAAASNPYTFTVTYADNVAVAVTTLPGAVVQVQPPGASAPILATVKSVQAVGAIDAIGDARSFVVTYQISPPTGSWTAGDNGSYTIRLGGGTVSDLAGNAVAAGTLGTFTVNIVSSTAQGSFAKADTTTQGFWKKAYGADGYNVIGDSSSYPAYAQVAVSGQHAYTWDGSTMDVRALQKFSNPSDHIAGGWYSTTGFTIDIRFTDGQTHQVALYLLDWDTPIRTEQLSVIDAGTGTVLDTEPAANFHNGEYLVWNLSGHVTIQVTCTGGWNAVVNGLFFGGGSSTAGSATGTYVKTDTTTQAFWKKAYGADGYNVLGNAQSYPSYAQITTTGAAGYTWDASTTDLRALQKVNNPTDHVAGTWYSSSSFTLDINLTDGQTHQLALYLLDWDSNVRSEQINLIDAGTGTVLDSRSLSAFHNGEYVVWNVSGHVLIHITCTGGNNAVVSGLFFGGGSSSAGSAAAAFVKADTTTQGSWKNVYGSDGYNVIRDSASLPSYAQVSATGQNVYTWDGAATDVRALQKATSPTDRIAATWYSTTSFTIDVNFTDTQAHQLALYLLDWDTSIRGEQISIIDAGSGTVLDTEPASNFHNGLYLVWNITGHVQIQVTATAGWNAVLSGLFFEAAS